MATYRVTAPNGKTYEVNAPDGTSQQDVMNYVKSHYVQQDMNSQYWQAAQSGDQNRIKSIYDQMRAMGVNPGPPPSSQDLTRKPESPVPGEEIGPAFGIKGMPTLYVGGAPGIFGNPDLSVAAAHHLASLPVGIAQLAAHGGALASDMVSPPQRNVGDLVSGQQPQSVADRIASSIDQYAANRERQYQKVVPDGAATTTGAAAGEILPWATGLGELRAAGVIPEATTAAGKIASLAAEGAAMGAAQPVTQGDFAKQKALQVGIGAASAPALKLAGDVAAKGVGSALGGAKGVYQHLFNPNAVAEQEVARLFGPDALAGLGARSGVPGEVLPATQTVKGPQGVILDRMLRNNPNAASALAARDAANNQARMDVIRGIAQEPAQGAPDAAMQAARQARDAATADFRNTYLDSGKSPTQQGHLPAVRWSQAEDALQALVDNPGRMPTHDVNALKEAAQLARKVRQGSIQEDDASKELKDIADSVTSKKAQDAFANATGSINTNMVDPTPVLDNLKRLRYGPIGTDDVRAAKLENLIKTIDGARNTNGQVSIALMDGVRQKLGGILGKMEGQNAYLMSQPYDQMVSFIERHAPGYRDYLANYAKHSQPINDMEAARAFLDRVGRNRPDIGGDTFATLSNLKSLINSDEKAQYGFSPEARNKIDQVLESVRQRGRLDVNPGPAGSPTEINRRLGYSRPGKLIFGNPLSGRPGWGSRVAGGVLGGLVGSHVPVPGATEIGALMGMRLPAAAESINSGIAQRIGEIASNPEATRQAILNNMPKNSRAPLMSALDYLLYGTPLAIKKATP